MDIPDIDVNVLLIDPYRKYFLELLKTKDLNRREVLIFQMIKNIRCTLHYFETSLLVFHLYEACGIDRFDLYKISLDLFNTGYKECKNYHDYSMAHCFASVPNRKRENQRNPLQIYFEFKKVADDAFRQKYARVSNIYQVIGMIDCLSDDEFDKILLKMSKKYKGDSFDVFYILAVDGLAKSGDKGKFTRIIKLALLVNSDIDSKQWMTFLNNLEIDIKKRYFKGEARFDTLISIIINEQKKYNG